MSSQPLKTNDPALWRAHLPRPAADGHKYDRGHVVVFGSVRLTGAARMAAQAAMRAGAGLCTIVAPQDAADIYRADAPHIMVESWGSVPAHLADPRRNAVVIGPGLEGDVSAAVLAVLAARRATVLDAGALTCFAPAPALLFAALHEGCVLTPHAGEFTRLFGNVPGGRVERAEQAAGQAGCTVLLKGAQTVLAAPGHAPVVSDHATPYLATAGAGDVLAGLLAGLLAQGMDPFDAACAAAWIHGEAALRFGPGLVAPDLIDGIPAVLRELV
jgi:NAD(P)H-hydrate epimerase